MPVTLFATTPETLFTEDSQISLSGITSFTVLHRFKINTAIDFNDIIFRSNGSFGYTLKGGTSGQINCRFRTNGDSPEIPGIVTGITAGDEITVITVATIGADVKYYANGALVTTTSDPTSTAFLGNWLGELEGPGIAGRSMELIEEAYWVSTPPSETDILNYPATTALADFGVQPTRQRTPVGTNGVYVPAILADIGGVDMTGAGTNPTTGGLEPVYSGATEFITIDFDPIICQRSTDTGYTGTFSGDWALPGSPSVEFRVTVDGVVSPGLDWQAPTGLTVGASDWSGTIGEIPVGSDIIIQVRAAEYPEVVGSSGIFRVGEVFDLYGQSKASRMTSDIPTDPVVVANSDAIIKSSGSWTQNASAAQYLANKINDLLAVPVGVIVNALGGTAISLLKPGSAQWDNFVAPDVAATRGMAGMIFIQGESNVGTDPAVYKTDLGEIQSECYVISGGRDSSNFGFYVSQLGSNIGSADVTLWPRMRNTQADYCADTVGATLAAITTDIPMEDDGLHHTPNGSAILVDRIVKTFSNQEGISAVDGLGGSASTFYIDGNNLIVNLSANGASSFIKNTGSAATGWQVFADDSLAIELTITDAQISGNTVVLTVSEVPAEANVVQHLYYADPDLTNQVKATGYDIGDIGLQQSFVEFRSQIQPENVNISNAISSPVISEVVSIVPEDVSIGIAVSSPTITEKASIEPENVTIGLTVSSPIITETSFTYTSKLVIVRG